jgi:hypothetical protein
MPGILAFLALRSDAGESPLFRVALEHAAVGAFEPDAPARFTWTVADVDLCLQLVRSGAASVSPCLRLEAGALDVASTAPRAPRSSTRPWAATGALVHGELFLLRGLFLVVDAGATARWTRDRFFLEPDTTLFDVPLIGLSGGAGLGASFL